MIKRVLLLALTLLVPTSVFAQDESHWGVAVRVTPTWKVPSNFKVLFDAETVDIKSQDFSIGIARGRTLGGDWSVSYVRKNFKDGSFADNTETRCNDFGVSGCFKQGSIRTLRGVTVTGIEALKFISFATIKERVQIGLNVGGGIGSLKGNQEIREFDVDVTCSGSRCTGRQSESVFTADVQDEDEDNRLYALPMYPLGKVEVAVGVIVAPGLKVRVGGGLDFPGQNTFHITGVYLIGAN
jgi:hypothetical protein